MNGVSAIDKEHLSITKGLKEIIQNSDYRDFTMARDLCGELGRITDANVLLADKSGKILCNILLQKQPQLLNIREQKSQSFIDSQLNEQLKTIYEANLNMSLIGYYIKTVSKTELKKYTAAVYPTIAARQRNGTLMLYKNKSTFTPENQYAIEFCSPILSLTIAFALNKETAEESRKTDMVRSALSILSFSELEAVVYIFQELDTKEGIIVAKKIADSVGITRSVIVNALRKLESAGIIESRSLGMKGTFIRVINDYLMEEIKNYSSTSLKSKRFLPQE